MQYNYEGNDLGEIIDRHNRRARRIKFILKIFSYLVIYLLGVITGFEIS